MLVLYTVVVVLHCEHTSVNVTQSKEPGETKTVAIVANESVIVAVVPPTTAVFVILGE